MKRVIVDILMVFVIVLEFLSLPILIHEIAGISLLFLIILHLNFNKKYFKAIGKGKYTLKRTWGLIVNIGLLISLLITIFSGIFTSQKTLKNIKIGNYKMSKIHKASSISSLILLVLHLLVTRKKLSGQLKNEIQIKK